MIDAAPLHPGGRASRRSIAVLIACAPLVLAIPGVAQAPSRAELPVPIVVEAQPLAAFDIRDRSSHQFGLLEFRGGLVLRSSYRNFGGISAIRVAADGARFIALSDKGWWLRGRIVYEGARPSAIADAEMAPILGADGRPLADRGWYDTESIADLRCRCARLAVAADGRSILFDRVGDLPPTSRSQCRVYLGRVAK